MLGVSSTAVSKAVKKKERHYASLMQLYRFQVMDGSRAPNSCQFFGAVVSHLAEFSSPIFNLVSWMADCYKALLSRQAHARGHARPDGLTDGALVAAYRTSLKDAVVVAIADGFGRMLVNAGVPRPVRPRAMMRPAF